MRRLLVLSLAAGVSSLSIYAFPADGQGPSARTSAPTPFFDVADLKPGMTGTGRTVYAGQTLEDFNVQIIGTLANVVGPGRRLVIARLSGGPIDQAGVIAGMSGSPVYIDGRLLGAVSYALGSFSKEPLAGITPIDEMISDVGTAAAPRATGAREFALPTSASSDQVLDMLRKVLARAGGLSSGPVSAAPFADAALHRIAAALSVRGFDPSLSLPLSGTSGAPNPSETQTVTEPLRPGDPIGASLMRGDFEVGATGTVTYVDGDRVYAFGHPFLGMGPARMPMTRARVYAVLPSLQSSMKIADLGPAIGTVSQDRATAIGGTMGPRPQEMDVALKLVPAAGAPRTFSFHILEDSTLTPLFAYVSMLNVLVSYHRQTGPLDVGISGSASFGNDGTFVVDDQFSGDQALTGVANTVLGPLTAMMNNDFKAATPQKLDVTLRVMEGQDGLSIERAWLDTAHPRFGGTHTLHVLLRTFRGGTRTVSMPIAMPAGGPASMTLLVSDAPTLAALEDKELDPAIAHSIGELIDGLNRIRRNNRLYVRLLAAAPGAITAGRAQPNLPASTRSVIETDKSVSLAPMTRSVAGAWEQRFDAVVRGSREIPLTLEKEIK